MQRPATPQRVGALDLRPRGGGALRGVRRRARGARRVGGVGAQPVRGRHGWRAGARRRAVVGRRGRVGRPDVQHLRVRARHARPHRVPGVGPRRGARRRRPRQGLREAEGGHRRGRPEPGVAGRVRRLRRQPRSPRHGRRQPRRQGEAGPAEGDHNRRRHRRRQPRQEAQYSWSPERCELGNPAADGSHLREIPQDVQVGRPCMVLPPCHLSDNRLRGRSLRLGHGHQPREPVQGRHLHSSPQHRHRRLRSCHPTSFRAVPEAQEGAQVPGVLEHVPPLRGIHRHHPRHHQHLQRHDHPRRRAAVEDRLRGRHLRPRRRRGGPRGRHLEHGRQEAQGREQDLQQRLQWPPPACRLNSQFFWRFVHPLLCVYYLGRQIGLVDPVILARLFLYRN